MPTPLTSRFREALLSGRAPSRIETYSFTAAIGDRYRWNITEAWRLIERSPREPDWFAPQQQGVSLAHIRKRAPELDAAYAMTTDVAKPLLFVPFAGEHLLVDGWHRLYRAVAEGVTDLMAYTLSEEEATAVLMEYHPAKGPLLSDGVKVYKGSPHETDHRAR